MTRTSTLFAATGLSVFLASTAAFAQDDSTTKPDDPRKAQAGVLLNEGLHLHDQDKENEALAKFQESYRIFPSPNVLFNIAREEQLLQKPLDAIRDYRKALRSPLLDPQRRDAARSYITELEPKLAKISVRASGGALVSVDGALIEEHAPLPEAIDVAPGRHVLEAKDTKGKVVRVEVSCAAGETQRANLVEETVVTPPVEPEPGFWTKRRVAGAVIGAAGIVALGVGAGVYAAAGSDADTVDALKAAHPGANNFCNAGPEPGPCANASDAASARSTKHNVGAGFMVGGAVAAVGGVVLLLLPNKKRRESPTTGQLTPWFSPAGGGAQWVSHF